MKLYKEVYIKSEEDLPKEDCSFPVCYRNDFDLECWAIGYVFDDKFRDINTDDILNIDWYLQPIKEISDRETKQSELKSIIHEVIWQYCYGNGNTDALFNYQDIGNASNEIVEQYFQPPLKSEPDINTPFFGNSGTRVPVEEISDEEIVKESHTNKKVLKSIVSMKSFTEGAKWYRDKMKQ